MKHLLAPRLAFSRPFKLIVLFAAMTALVISAAGYRQIDGLANWLVPTASADIKFFNSGPGTSVNTCVSSGCHDGLRVLEQIHPKFSVTCVQCHGGNDRQASKNRSHVQRPSGFGRFPLKSGSHPANRDPEELRGPRAYALSDTDNSDHENKRMLAYRQFINPGDLLVADKSCGGSSCHKDVVHNVERSLHSTMAGLMNGMYYANGHPGASDGTLADFMGTDEDKAATLAILLPRGKPIRDANFNPNIKGTVEKLAKEVPRNDEALRNRKKSDPLGMIGFYIQTDCARCHLYTTGNKDIGSMRSTGCSACHVEYSNEGFSETFDRQTKSNETDHAIKHSMVRFPSVQQCAHCHNRGARHTQRFLGFRERPQGDNGSQILNENADNTRVVDQERLDDGDFSGGRKGGFYPEAPLYMKPGDDLFGKPFPTFPKKAGNKNVIVGKSNESIWRRDMRVNETRDDNFNPFWVVDEDRTNDYDETPPDIHAEAGMICIDCHLKKELHGDGRIYTDRFHRVEITCESCHGTATKVSKMRTRKGTNIPRMSRDGDVFTLKLKATGETVVVPQLKDSIDAGLNENALGPSHTEHDRLECYACHATWHDQCNSCHMITSYDTVRDDSNEIVIRPDTDQADCRDDPGCFFQRGHMDNKKKNAAQGQPRFVTTFDQLILGINNKGKISNFHTSGQAVLFANKLVGGQGSEKALHESNFMELSQCSGGANDGNMCEVDSDCPGGTCPGFTCAGGPFAGLSAEAEAQCGRCELGGVPTGELCAVDSTCKGDGEICNTGTLTPRVCIGGTTPGAACTWDPNNPTDPGTCAGAGATCGVRMYNFVFSTLDQDDGGMVRHLPAFPINPMFPHTVRTVPRNCDNCHLNPDMSNIDLVKKAIGIGTGMAPVLDSGAPGNRREVSITRRVRIFTNGKGALTGVNAIDDDLPAETGDLVDIDIDNFIDVDFEGGKDLDVDSPPFFVDEIRQVKPTTHVDTGPLDRRAIERLLSGTYAPQSPTSLSRRAEVFVAGRQDAFLGSSPAEFGADLFSPAPGTKLRGKTTVFRWRGFNTGPSTQWRLDIGSRPGKRDVYRGKTAKGIKRLTVRDLRTNGDDVYVRLYYRNSSKEDWQFVEAKYRSIDNRQSSRRVKQNRKNA